MSGIESVRVIGRYLAGAPSLVEQARVHPGRTTSAHNDERVVSHVGRVYGHRELALVWYALIAVLVTMMVAYTPWTIDYSGVDLSRYLDGARGLFAGDAYGRGLLYSPAFAALVSPLALLPFPVALLLWRAAELAALAFAVRGQPLALLVFVMPWLWASELLAANVNGFATAAMIVVIRWPSVRTVALYAVLVALIPKPAFLPVLAYGFVMVPQARRWVVVAGLGGLVMLAWPGYLDAMLHGHDGADATLRWPLWVVALAAPVTLIGLRWPRVLGVAAVLASPYVWPYSLMPLAVGMVRR